MELTLECACGWEVRAREGAMTVECAECGARYAVTVTTIQGPDEGALD